MTDYPHPFRIATSEARSQLSRLITRVQDPRAACILTRHGHPVAALVSMAELKRIWNQHDIEDIVHNGRQPAFFRLGRGGHMSNGEAAEAVQRAQLDRRTEREVLKAAGLDEIPGGELTMEVEMPVAAPVQVQQARRRWWRFW